jgi:Transport protein Trs120 or TRAPPC9, TRAPP II complex subunit
MVFDSLLVRIPRLRLPTWQISEPIPTLSDRQFVVSKVPVADQDRALERIRLTWREVGSLRQGDVPLRRLRLTMSMLEDLRADRVELGLELVGGRRRRRELLLATAPSTTHGAASSSWWYADENEFLAVKALVRNCSGAFLLSSVPIRTTFLTP